jgi:hypothetical protein
LIALSVDGIGLVTLGGANRGRVISGSTLSEKIRVAVDFRASPSTSQCRAGDAGRKPRRRTMRVMVLVKATENSEKGILPSPQLFEEMGKFNDALRAAGILRDAAGLKPTSKGKRVVFDGVKRAVIDGPFVETKELVAGFWIWEVRDMDEAVAWVKRCPNPMPGPSEIEIRPFYEAADFR